MAPPPFPVAPPKKGLPPFAWVGIGCGGVIVLILLIAGIVGLTVGKSVLSKFKQHPALPMVEEVLQTHPEIGRLAENQEAGTVILAPNGSPDQVKTTYDEIVRGKVVMPDPSGTPVPLFQGDLTKVPAWVPRYPGASGITSLVHEDLPDKIHGIMVMEIADTMDDVEKFADTEAAKLFSSSSTSRSNYDLNGTRRARFSYAGGKKELTFLAYGKSGSPLTVMVVYTERK